MKYGIKNGGKIMDSKFGEIDADSPNFYYDYANELAEMTMSLLEDDERFKDMTKADVLNFALSLLNICLLQFKKAKMSQHLKIVLNDFAEFKELALLIINDVRHTNKTELLPMRRSYVVDKDLLLNEILETENTEEIAEIIKKRKGDD